jgi:hypothetical protein
MKTFPPLLGSALLLLGLALAAPVHAAPSLVPPTETYAGKTHSQWLDSWFTWMFSIPGGAQDFPFMDPTGANSGANQSGPVFFFAKSWLGVKGNPSEQRSATVPEGTALFLPFNGYYIDPNPDRDPATITAENRAALNDWGTQVFKLVVDGQEIPTDSSLTSPILHASSVYTLSIPANAAARSPDVGYGNLPEAVYPFQSYEWFVLLKPLPVGRHVVHLFNNGFIGTPNEWVSDVVWTIDVKPRPLRRSVLATSTTEFSGFRDVAGWSYGHRTAPAAGASENYDPARDFIPFSGGPAQGDWDGQRQQWNGTAWKAKDGTELAAGSSRLAAANRWTIRRWQASELLEKSPAALKWTLAKADATCGNGVTGALYINGQLVDKATVPFDRADALTRTFYALLTPGDVVDLALRPLGADGTDDLGCDSALMTLSVSTLIPNFPRQPDNKVFLSSLPTRKLEILSQATANGRSALNWSSQASATYGIKASGDLVKWTDLASGLPGNPTVTRWSEPLNSPEQPTRFYRVVEESKTIEGLWVALYGDGYELIRITLDGDQAVATKLIGNTYIRSGEVTWKANVKTGVGQIQIATGSDDQGRAWEPQTLKIINPDRLSLTDTSCSCPPQVFRRVD